MALLPVEEALERVLDGAQPVAPEMLALDEAAGRVLAEPLVALRTQPPFDASAMDGYAVRFPDAAVAGARLKLIGEAPAGRPFEGEVGPMEAARIFTGAPLPSGADTVLIQENARRDGQWVEVLQPAEPDRHVRRRGLDFQAGDRLMEAGRVLDPAALALAASANHPRLAVVGRPLVALIATGDELLPPGSDAGPGQIIASNGFGVGAVARAAGGRVLDLGIVGDERAAIAARLRQATDAGADVVVTLGGASVGEHDLMREVLAGVGVALDFWKIAMRPGKPLMSGRLGPTRFLGLPGNPVASLVCAHVFLAPLVARLAGRMRRDAYRRAVLGSALAANDQRQDYLRARLARDGEDLVASPFSVQDSSMLRVLADSDALIVRPPHAPAAAAGEPCRVMVLRDDFH